MSLAMVSCSTKAIPEDRVKRQHQGFLLGEIVEEIVEGAVEGAVEGVLHGGHHYGI